MPAGRFPSFRRPRSPGVAKNEFARTDDDGGGGSPPLPPRTNAHTRRSVVHARERSRGAAVEGSLGVTGVTKWTRRTRWGDGGRAQSWRTTKAAAAAAAARRVVIDPPPPLPPSSPRGVTNFRAGAFERTVERNIVPPSSPCLCVCVFAWYARSV